MKRMRLEPLEIKLLILYIIKTANKPLTAVEITDIVLADSVLDFFETHQYLSELVDNEQVVLNEDHTYSLSHDAEDAVDYFNNKIPFSIKEKIYHEITKLNHKLESDSLIAAQCYSIDGIEYEVSLSVNENQTTNLMKLSFRVVGRETAENICKRWKEDNAKIYGSIIELLAK